MNEEDLAKNSEATKTDGPKTLRTYESDVAAVLARRNTSAVTMALAESKRKQAQEIIATNSASESSSVGKKILIISLSLVFIAIGILGAYYLYSVSPLAPKPSTPATTPVTNALLPVDSQVVINLPTINKKTLVAAVNAELNGNQQNNTLKSVVLQTIDKSKCTNETCDEIKATPISIQSALAAIGITPPDILVRALNPLWLLGIYSNDLGNKSVFIVVSNNLFQNTFAGMLQWESVMPDDLKDFLLKGSQSYTATSTQIYPTIRGNFIDRIIKSKDVREYVSADGKLLFLYSFLDNNRLIVATDENIIPEAMSRLEKQDYMR